ncbi:MAG: hypothetical protein LC637_08265 [Xanthomonadaceae bacterium]|nr:hypothetical protein [Xanthomonadaceae bacterium]
MNIRFYTSLMLGLFLCGSVFAQSCDEEFVGIDNNALQVNVLPTGSDDTENIQCGLDLATISGIPVVKLQRASYFISSVIVRDFSGRFEGTTRDSTTLRVLPNSINCAAMAAAGQAPAALKFVEGRPILQFMRIEYDAAVEPCTDGAALRSLVHLTGTATGSAECSNDVIFGQVDRIDFATRGLALGGTFALEAGAEGAVLGGCKNTLLGTIKVNRSSFSNFEFSIGTQLRGQAQVDINFNVFNPGDLNNLTLADIVLIDTGQSTSVIGNEFNGSSTADNGYSAIFMAAVSAESPASTRLAVESNTFNIAGDASADAIALGLPVDLQAQNGRISIAGNVFNLETTGDTEVTGVFVTDLSRGTIVGNRFAGSGTGVFLNSGNRAVLDWYIGANTGFANLESEQASVFFGAGTSNNIVGPSQSASVLDFGSNTVLQEGITQAFLPVRR